MKKIKVIAASGAAGLVLGPIALGLAAPAFADDGPPPPAPAPCQGIEDLCTQAALEGTADIIRAVLSPITIFGGGGGHHDHDRGPIPGWHP